MRPYSQVRSLTYTHRDVMKPLRGGHLRPQTGVVLNSELSMGAGTGNNQAQYPKVADST